MAAAEQAEAAEAQRVFDGIAKEDTGGAGIGDGERKEEDENGDG